jgi:hypothetical protein
MADISRALTLVHVALAGAVLCAFVGVAAVGGAFLDRVTPVVFWVWVLGAPFVGGAALVASRRVSMRRRVVTNGVLLSIWAVGLTGALLLH